jgi:hypothetical protein
MDAKTLRTMSCKMMPAAGLVAAPWMMAYGEALEAETGGNSANANVQPLESSQSTEASETALATNGEAARSRRAVHRFLVGLVAVLGIVSLSPQSALAEAGRKFVTGHTTCFSELGPYGGWLVSYGYGDVGLGWRRATLRSATATVDAYRCNGPKEDIPLIVSHLTVQLIYTIQLLGFSQCQFGIQSNPKGGTVSCTVVGNTMTITATNKCSNASSCTVDFGPDNEYPGGLFVNALGLVTVRVIDLC